MRFFVLALGLAACGGAPEEIGTTQQDLNSQTIANQIQRVRLSTDVIAPQLYDFQDPVRLSSDFDRPGEFGGSGPLTGGAAPTTPQSADSCCANDACGEGLKCDHASPGTCGAAGRCVPCD
jgi:hypothetical protein